MSKFFKAGLAATAMFAALGSAAVPMTASAMPQANGITNCDAPGGRQQAGAAIGAVQGQRSDSPCNGGPGRAALTGAGVYAAGGATTIAGSMLAIRFLF